MITREIHGDVVARAVAAEQGVVDPAAARLAAVLNLPAAHGRAAQARHLATATDISPAMCAKILAAGATDPEGDLAAAAVQAFREQRGLRLP